MKIGENKTERNRDILNDDRKMHMENEPRFASECDCDYASYPIIPQPMQQLVADGAVEHGLLMPHSSCLDMSASTLIRAAWALMASHLTNSKRVVFGTTIYGRRATVIGLEVSAPTVTAVAVHAQWQGNQTVSDYLQAVRQAAVQAPAKQTDVGRVECMFQTLLDVQSHDHHHIHGRGQRGCQEYALVLEIAVGRHQATAKARFDSRVVAPWAVRKLLEQLEFVLGQLVNADPERMLAEIEVLTPQDLDAIWGWNRTVPAPVERCVHDLIQDVVQTQPNAPAVCAWDGELTYGELDRLAVCVAARLVDLGVGPNVLVPLCFDKSMWTIVAKLGVLKAGGAFILLDPSLPEQRLRAIVGELRAGLLLSSASTRELGLRLVPEVVTLSSDLLLTDLASHDAVAASPDAVMYVIFTSGSTGTPKGVIITHSNFASALHHQLGSLGITSASRLFDFAAYSFDISISNAFRTLAAGGCLCIPNEQDRRNCLVQSIASLQANAVHFTPSVAQLLVLDDAAELQTIFLGGETVRVRDIKPWWDKVRLVHEYGPSECTPTSTINCNKSTPEEAARIGTGAGLVTWVVNAEDHNKLVPLGFVGELLLEGPLVGRGYLNDADKTASAFIEDTPWLLRGTASCPGRHGRLYKTGDLVRYNEDGSLTFVCRKDQQVKIRGQRVELGDIEHHVKQLIPEAEQVVAEVIKLQDEDGRPVLVAFIQMSRQADEVDNASVKLLHVAAVVKKRLTERLPSYMVPTVFFAMAKLPMTSSGKMNRTRLREIGQSILVDGVEQAHQSSRRAAHNAKNGTPMSETEHPVYALAEKVLAMLPPAHRRGLLPNGRDGIGTGIDFDNVPLSLCGLDSVNMMSLIHFIRRQFQVMIDMRLLMNGRTSIRSLGEHVMNLQVGALNGCTEAPTSVDLLTEISQYDSMIAAAQLEAPLSVETKSRDDLTILLTGANGFIGTQILRQLLNHNKVAAVIALVRGETEDGARKRTIDAAKKARWWAQDYEKKLHVWLGDLGSPRLGRNASDWSLLGHKIDAVIHNGATVHLGKSYAQLKAANVGSTADLLRLIAAKPSVKFVYVSTLRHRTSMSETEDDAARLLANSIGYNQTKFVAEALVRRAALRCAPGSNHLVALCPGFVIGTPNEGVANAGDHFWRLVAACIKVGAYNADEADGWVYVSDVMSTVKYIVEAALEPGALPKAVAHVSDGITWRHFWDLVRGIGYPIQARHAAEWLAAVRQDIELGGEAHPMWPLAHMLENRVTQQASHENGLTPKSLKVAVTKNIEYLASVGFLPLAVPGVLDATADNKASLSSGWHHQLCGNRLGDEIEHLAWSHSNEASNDLRSDTCTKPTLPMLEAIIKTSLGDNDMEEDPTTNSFQSYVAELLGHEASLLVASGTMGNQVALRTVLSAPPYSILADHRGHIITLEGGGASTVCGAMIKMVVPCNGHHLTLADVQRNCTLTETVYDCPTRVISLENTLEGTIMPLCDIRAISKWARAKEPPIHMHLDGARLWEAVAAGTCTLREIGECFDSIQLCLSKGIGAPIGSVVVGSSVFIQRAKWSRKLLGGSIRAAGLVAAPARVAIDTVFLGNMLKHAHDKARRASALWEQLGGKLRTPTETNMVWPDLEASGLAHDDFYPVAKKFGLKVWDLMSGRLVFHYQITDDTFARLCDFFHAVLEKKPGRI
ncbi:hypothetical protein CDD81_4179 [Ophiocordyceps australis]|uniref:Carrier domain-containing protein n=1 Tax=Ophiocordyceps australis TaxID=1399860 RepID=A0A2C5XDS5_9HYPO|nr:hypothetical protein CDD81_4179 [Ophiocordyceps australis]